MLGDQESWSPVASQRFYAFLTTYRTTMKGAQSQANDVPMVGGTTPWLHTYAHLCLPTKRVTYFYFMCVSVFACMHMCAMKIKEGIRSPRSGVIDSELPASTGAVSTLIHWVTSLDPILAFYLRWSATLESWDRLRFTTPLSCSFQCDRVE